MYSLDDTADTVQALITEAEDDPIPRHQAADGAAQIAAMHYAIAVFDIGMLTKTADDQSLLG